MTAKKVKRNVQLTIDGLKSGMVIPDLHDEDVKISNNLIDQMRKFEQENPKTHAIYNGRVTGRFLYWKYFEDHLKRKINQKRNLVDH